MHSDISTLKLELRKDLGPGSGKRGKQAGMPGICAWLPAPGDVPLLEGTVEGAAGAEAQGLTERSTTVLMALSFLLMKSSSCKREHRDSTTLLRIKLGCTHRSPLSNSCPSLLCRKKSKLVNKLCLGMCMLLYLRVHVCACVWRPEDNRSCSSSGAI